jgi:hypothetical protein
MLCDAMLTVVILGVVILGVVLLFSKSKGVCTIGSAWNRSRIDRLMAQKIVGTQDCHIFEFVKFKSNVTSSI